ncbi:bile acid:sodium symporter family protein [Gordonia sp. (in: high G+C Gram-positive bacteria)]|uniref:bile acid:sodium symporter family protein n=1 Tax=Gordonia sp. (in: high G+C Gram-positive bacteria) TaxID=84139 RepID=UPI0039E4C013
MSTPAPAAQERLARTAVTVFPLLVLAAGIAGYLAPSAFTPMAHQVPYLLGVIMFCMGLTLTPPDFAAVARRPWAVVLGIVAHYVIMPGAGWAIAHALGLSPELAVGVILVGCAPSGTASNVMTYLAKGDVALSVAVASVSTLIAPLLTPFLVWLLAGSYLKIDAGSMVLDIVKTVLVPVVLGLLVRALAQRWVGKALPALPWISALVIALIVAIVVAGSAAKIATAGAIVFLAVVLHNGFGLALGYLAGRLGGLDDKARRALAFEVGMQNSGLAATLATAHFSPLAALPSAVFSVWHNISGAVVAAWLARRPLAD